MLRRLRSLFFRLTGGRPMRRVGFAFTDIVDGQGVHYYEDRLGRRWLANRGFSLFRVPAGRRST